MKWYQSGGRSSSFTPGRAEAKQKGKMKGGENQWEGNGKIRQPSVSRGAFFHVVPLNRPVRPVLMSVPLGVSHQLGCSERRRGAAACFPHKPAATRCRNKPRSARRPSIVGNRPRLRKQGGDAGVHYCSLPSHTSHFASADFDSRHSCSVYS